MRRGHGTCHKIDMTGGTVPRRRQIEMLQNLQHGDQRHATAGRRIRGHLISAIAALYRLARAWPIICEIVCRDETAVRREVPGDLCAEFSGIETFRTFGGDPLERTRHTGIVVHLSDGIETAIVTQVDTFAFFRCGDPLQTARHAGHHRP